MFILFLPDVVTTANVIITCVLILIGLSITILVFLGKKQDQTLVIEKARGDAQEKLVKVRELEISDLTKDNGKLLADKEKLESEIEEVTSEYRALAAIDVDKLMQYWAIREHELAEIVKLRSENRILRRAAGIGDTDAIIHTTEG